MASQSLVLQTQNGLNNRSKTQTTDPTYVAQAVNVDFADSGEIRKRNGTTKIYNGVRCHSFFKYNDSVAYFVENGDLKSLDLIAKTAATLKTGVGHNAMSYTVSAGKCYFSNGDMVGSIVNGVFRAWGVKRPDRNPDLSAVPLGGLFAGVYAVCLTYLSSGEESGAIAASFVNVAHGGGIALSNFPLPPPEIDKIAVYVTSNNGKNLYLYGEFTASTQSLTIGYHISDIPLMTQFCFPPLSFSVVGSHFGRVFGAVGNVVYYSEPQRHGLFKANNYMVFTGNVKIIIAVKSALFIVADKTYRIDNLNGDGYPVLTEIFPFGAVGAAVKDPVQESAVWMSDKGYVVATDENGVSLLNYDHIAVDKYTKGAVTVLEHDGIKQVIGSFR